MSPSVPSPVPAGTEREALALIASWPCESFREPLNADPTPCFRWGRTADALYGVDRACAPCIARRALAAVVSSSPATPEGDAQDLLNLMGSGDVKAVREVLARPAPSPASPAETREGRDYDEATDRAVFKTLREHRGADDFREQGECQCGWRRHEGWPSHDEHRARVIAQALAASPAVSLPGEAAPVLGSAGLVCHHGYYATECGCAAPSLPGEQPGGEG